MSEHIQKNTSGFKSIFITSNRCGTIAIDDITKDSCELAENAPNGSRDIQKDSRQTSFIRDIKDNKFIRFKVILSICVSLAVISWGWALGQMGPSFSDLMDITGVDLEKGSAFITSYITGRLVGSALGMILHSKMHTYLVFVVSLVTYGVIVAAIPWCFYYELMIAAHVVQGLSGGVLKVAVTSTSMSIWGPTRRGRIFILILYVFSSFSAAFSAMAMAPFVRQTTYVTGLRNIANLNATSNGSLNTMCCPGNSSDKNDTENATISVAYTQESKLYVAYFISGGIAFLVAVPFLVLYIKKRSNNIVRTEKKKDNFIGNHSRISNNLQLINVGLLSAMFHACHFLYPAYLTVFCVQHLHWTKVYGAMLTSVTVFTTVGGRLIGIFLVRMMESHTLLLCASALYLFGFVCMTVSAHLHAEIGIWISTCVIGLPLGVIWPSALSWINMNLIPVGVNVSSYLIVIGNIGTLSSPFLLGYLMQEISLLWFCYVCSVLSAIVMINSIFIVLHTKRKPDIYDD